MHIFTKLIIQKLNIDPNLVLKKPIRGLCGFNAYELIFALISTGSVPECASSLGYTLNPVKQAIRQLLIPLYPERSTEYASGGGAASWRKVLLAEIDHQYCSKCGIVKPYLQFQKDSHHNYSSNCKACRLIKTKLEKQYIVERTPAWADIDLINKFYHNCPEGYHVDHIIPLRGELVNGLHIITNLQYLPASINIAKGNKYEV